MAPHEETTLGEGSVGLADDIELHAERIRQERLSKRVKLQRQAEAALTATTTATPEMPLVGNLIGEDHVNYVLMYNMLTGIRIGVCFTLTSVIMV
jgi:1-phosphatidylinositol-4-phosphate 5-kinase